MKKRILFLVNSLGQGSGVMSFAMNYYKRIDREKYEIDFIFCTEVERSFKEELIMSGSNIYYIKRFKTSSIRDYLRFKKDIKIFFDNHGEHYDLIHSHVPLFTKYFFKEAKRVGIKGRVIHSHSVEQSNSYFKKIRNKFILRNVFQYTNAYMSCSKDAAFSLFGKERTNKEVVVIKNAIDTKKYEFNERHRKVIREEFSIQDKFVILHVGRLSEEKNHTYMISIMKELIKYDNNYIMMFVGDGVLYSQLYEKVKKEGLEEYIIFSGIRNDINNIMSASDCFILPSKHEGLGIVTIEAQSNGLPCLISDLVPDEINLTPLVYRLSIKENEIEWINLINKLKREKVRKQYIDKGILESEYDIESNVKFLEKEYKKIICHNR